MTLEQCTQFLQSIENNTTFTAEQILENCQFAGVFTKPLSSGAIGNIFLGALITLGILIVFLLILGLYIYTSLAWYTIAKKLKYKKPWLAWIPIANIAMMLQLGRFHWAWVFLILIPIIGWVALFIILIIARWHIFEKRKHPGWFSLAPIIPKVGGILHLIAIGFVAWQDK